MHSDFSLSDHPNAIAGVAVVFFRRVREAEHAWSVIQPASFPYPKWRVDAALLFPSPHHPTPPPIK